MKALILAAGMGNRLGHMTSDRPKALIEVGGTPLIDRALAFVDNSAVAGKAVVGGYHFELLMRRLKERDVKLYFNPDYTAGNITTIRAAIDFLDDDMLLMNVDHIYPDALLKHIIANSRGICAMCDFDRALGGDDMKVKLNGNGRLRKISKGLADYDGGYIGMTYIAKETIEAYKKAIGDTLDIYGKNTCVEFILGHMAANDAEINICDTSGFRWIEVDTPEDLENAERSLAKGKDKI